MQFNIILATLATLALSTASALPEPVLSGADPSPEALAALEARGEITAREVNSAKIALQKQCGTPSWWGYQPCACGYAAAAGIDINILGIIGIGAGAASGAVGPCY